MGNQYQFVLERGSKKHYCPNCGKKRFVRYVDTETGDYLPTQYGRCDRESNCGYNLNPYKDGYNKGIWRQELGEILTWKPSQLKPKIKLIDKPTFIPVEVLNRTRSGYEKNIFIQNLLTRVDFPFDVQDMESVISLYHLGTVKNGYRSGAITFPFIDLNGNVRTVQVKEFDQANHTTGTDFLHSIIKKHHVNNNKPVPKWLEAYENNETKVSCLFGEHLLRKYPHNPVALVEAPKTAIYSTLYFGFPQNPRNLLWLAVYNLSSLNLRKCQALKGRDVYLFPDLSKGGRAFELWSRKAVEIQSHLPETYFQVSDLLERLAPEIDKEQGKDIADYLIKMDWRLFRNKEIGEATKPHPIEASTYVKCEKSDVPNKSFPAEAGQKDDVLHGEYFIPEPRPSWNTDISDLEKFFASMELPNRPLMLNGCSIITDCQLFVDSHFRVINKNNGNKRFLPFLHRLQELKELLINQTKSN